MTSDLSIREDLSPEERALPLEHTIDPGFVNRRLVATVLGEDGMQIIDEYVRSLPQNPEPFRIDRAYTDVLLEYCRLKGICSLADILSTGCKAAMFCSTEQVFACPDVDCAMRVVSEIKPVGNSQNTQQMTTT